MKLQFLVLIICLFSLSGCNNSHLELFPELSDESIMERKLTVAEMKEDIDAFIEGSVQRHPDLAAYANIDHLTMSAERTKQTLTSPLLRTEFYRIVGQLTHLLNDGHSLLIWPYQEYELLKSRGNKSFPFEIEISQQGEIFIQHSYKNGDRLVPAASRVIAINGIKDKALLETLQQYAGGETRHLRNQFVEQRFGLNLWAVYGFLNDFELTFESQGRVLELSIKQNQDWKRVNADAQANESYYYKTIETGVGLLSLDSFDVSPDRFEDFIDKSFVQIKNDEVHSLIIDIRSNPGGNTDTVTYLARYLADKPFRLVSSVREKLNAENRGFLNYKGEVGEVLEDEWTDWEKPMNSGERFSGKTYLLVGAASYSAAIVFATTLQDNGFATLIGEETGGYANQSAQGNLFNLPNSELRAYITTRLLVRPNGDPSRVGVIPDYITELARLDLEAQLDKEVELALQLIDNRRQ